MDFPNECYPVMVLQTQKFWAVKPQRLSDWCGKSCKMCVCIHMHTQRERLFLRLLPGYGSWKPSAGCEGMLRKSAGVHWRSVLKITCGSPELFR